MKARLPYDYDYTSKGRRQAAVADAMLLFGKALQESGASGPFINRWIARLQTATAEVAGYNGSGFFNKEWTEQLDYWADQHQIGMPQPYRLSIPGGLEATGEGQSKLVLLELFTLTLMGYGDKRLHRVLEHYAELSGLYTGGRAKMSRQQLRDWANLSKVYF